jgi:hypothetical protein
MEGAPAARHLLRDRAVAAEAAHLVRLDGRGVLVDFEYVGQHSYNTLEGVNINAVDSGAAYLPANQDPTISSATPGRACRSRAAEPRGTTLDVRT